MNKQYDVAMEISGPAAMFMRPDSGSSPVSYPAPTYSAAKGIFESIARVKSAFIRPTRVEICRPVQFSRYTCNYGGPLRKADQIRKQSPYQLPAVILVDVCYRLYGSVEPVSESPGAFNHLHALQDMFLRRLRCGQSFRTPCLGWSEFLPDYVGEFRPETRALSDVNMSIPSMLHTVFDRSVSGKVAPRFVQNVEIRNGVLEYAD